MALRVPPRADSVRSANTGVDVFGDTLPRRGPAVQKEKRNKKFCVLASAGVWRLPNCAHSARGGNLHEGHDVAGGGGRVEGSAAATHRRKTRQRRLGGIDAQTVVNHSLKVK